VRCVAAPAATGCYKFLSIVRFTSFLLLGRNYADELPAGWGLQFAENGKIVTMIEAPKLIPCPIDRAFLASVMRRATKMSGG
jgi:hypothetical protein